MNNKEIQEFVDILYPFFLKKSTDFANQGLQKSVLSIYFT